MAMKCCPNCGEEYSDTYKKCPFCEEEEALRSGGKLRRGRRSAQRSRQFSLITPTLIVLILIMACLLVYLLYGDQLKDRFQKDDGTETPSAEDVVPVKPDPTQPDTNTQEPQEPDTEPGVMPDTPQQTPAAQTDYEAMMALGSGLTLSKEDFTMKSVGETAVLTVSGGSGSYTWASEDDGIASVDQNGKVTAISKGTVNIVVSDGSKKGVCIVRCNVSGSASPSASDPSSAAASTGTLKSGAAKVVNGGNGVRVRSGPGTNYEALATVPNGGSVQVVEDAGSGWYKITFSGSGGAMVSGYMKGEFLANS